MSPQTMLVKFQSSSNRVKNCSFHPTQPLLLIALHNGSVQLYNYLLGTLINTFYAHNGPVRGISFHPKQSMFVSGGDDYLIKLFSYKTTNQPSVLIGHLDYIRSVYFHDELSWIISASDDQTIRIWNYMNRSCIAILTGHNHYCMHALFTPSSYGNYIISCSLDQTIRIWDYAILKNKHTTNTANITLGDSFQMDVTVKFVLEGHDRGVNWIQVHPSQPLIISGADDRQVKVWRLGESRAWELSSFRGHYNNVSSVCFHPFLDLILSNSEDKSIRIWDLNKRTLINTFKRDNDRFWSITPHPNQALFACGHDSGVLVFKLARERPPMCVFNTNIYFIKSNNIIHYDTTTNTESILHTIKSNNPKSIHFNPIDQSFLIINQLDQQIESLPSQSQYTASNAVFLSRNRILLLNNANIQLIDTNNPNNQNNPQLPNFPPIITNIYSPVAYHLLVLSPTNIHYYNVQSTTLLFTIPLVNPKYATFSNNLICITSKHQLTLLDAQYTILAQHNESLRIKSTLFINDILIYTTLNHIKYLLVDGTVGILKSIDTVMYISSISNDMCTLHMLNRQSQITQIAINPTELIFKHALLNNNTPLINHIIQDGTLLGQSIIHHLQNNGHSQIAMSFVKDPIILYELAVECGRLDMAKTAISKIKDKLPYLRELGAHGMRHMDSQLVEYCQQQTHDLEMLQLLYLVNGNTTLLRKLMQLHKGKGQDNQVYQIGVLMGDTAMKIEVLIRQKQWALAYLELKSLGVVEGEQWELVNSKMPEKYKHTYACELSVIGGIQQPQDGLYVWPLKEEDFGGDGVVEGINTKEGIEGVIKDTKERIESPIASATAWGDDLDVLDEQVEEAVEKVSANTMRDLISKGDISGILVLVQGQYGIAPNNKILREFINRIIVGNRVNISIMGYTMGVEMQMGVYTMDVITRMHDNGLEMTTKGDFENAIKMFKKVVVMGLFVSDKMGLIVHECKEYIMGLMMEMERRRTTETEKQIKLGWYFATRKLQVAHRVLATRGIIGNSYKNGYYKLCLMGIREMEGLGVSAEILDKIQIIGKECRGKLVGSKEIRMVGDGEEICGIGFEVVGGFLICGICGGTFESKYKGDLCTICDMGEIGKTVVGYSAREY